MSIWVYILGWGVLVGSNLYALVENSDLRRALDTKDTMIDGELSRSVFEVMSLPPFGGASVSAGGSVVSTLGSLGIRVRIKSSRWTKLHISVEKI